MAHLLITLESLLSSSGLPVLLPCGPKKRTGGRQKGQSYCPKIRSNFPSLSSGLLAMVCFAFWGRLFHPLPALACYTCFLWTTESYLPP